jgi:serine/threonine protein phosphatase PrpC
MTRWVAGDFRPEPTVTPYRPTAEGLLVLATDGLWRYLSTPRDLVRKLDGAYTDATTAVTRLANAAGAAGGVDDLTVAALPSTPERARARVPPRRA